MPNSLYKVLSKVESPSYVVDENLLSKNMIVASRIRREAGCKILLATKAFALPSVFPFMRDHIDGTTASGLYEARLGREELGKEVHVYAPAYKDSEFEETVHLSDHIYFNNLQQIERYGSYVKSQHKKIGLRINPGYSNATLGGDLYNPCAPCSRFGALPEELANIPWENVDILHTHVLCESLHEGSINLINFISENFGEYVRRVKTINFGGGHFINKVGYDVDALIVAIKSFKKKFPDVEVILEPGSGLVVDAGYLVATVLAIHNNQKNIAILDTSASCHMPDVLEVPYIPTILDAAADGVYPHSYILTGRTCMTGDTIGEYSFVEPLKEGSRLIFSDMLQYSFVKNNTFNGTPLPNIVILEKSGRVQTLSQFGYEDFRSRLGNL